MHHMLGSQNLGNLWCCFLRHFLAEPHLTYDSHRRHCVTLYWTMSTHDNNQYLTWSWTQLQCSVNNFSCSCCKCLEKSHAVHTSSQQMKAVFYSIITHTSYSDMERYWSAGTYIQEVLAQNQHNGESCNHSSEHQYMFVVAWIVSRVTWNLLGGCNLL